METRAVEAAMHLRPRRKSGWCQVASRYSAAFALLSAAGMKWYTVAEFGDLSSTWAGVTAPMGIAAFETALALLLVSGISPRPVQHFAAATFLVFGIYSGYRALSGFASCGCFGVVDFDPRIIAICDFLLAALLAFAGLATPSASTPRSGVLVCCGLSMAVALPASAYAALRAIHRTETVTSASSGTSQVLYPDHWAGRKLPILSSISDGERLSVGKWLVILHDDACSVCLRHLPEYKGLASQLSQSNTNLALIDVRPPAPQSTTAELDNAPRFRRAHLDFTKSWKVQTPTRLYLVDGVVAGVE